MQRASLSRLIETASLIGVLAAGCSGGPAATTGTPAPPGGSAVPGSATPSGTAAPLASATLGRVTVCMPPADPAVAWPAVTSDWPGPRAPTGLAAAVEAETAGLTAAIGNPDTGSSSTAWDAFERALATDDAVAIRAAAAAVLGHLRSACAAVSPFFVAAGAAAWAADVRGLLDGIATGVAALREGAIDGDGPRVAAARTRMQDALLDHFYQSFRWSKPDAYRSTLSGSRSATASHVRWSDGVAGAFDGSADTAWKAGDVAPPQWIELDLGAEVAVTGIRLQVWQEVAGPTDHLVTVRTATGEARDLGRLTGDTRDAQWLEITAPAPVTNVRYVRVTTLAAPSMIGWREMEVVTAGASSPGPCPAASSPLTDVSKTTSDPSTGASDPALAVDGNEATGWDPGPVRGGADARGWIRVFHATQFRASAVRLLLGQGSPAVTYEVVLFPPGEVGQRLGTIESVPADGGWVTLAGPDPCLPFESVYVFVRSAKPAGSIREIQLVGTPRR